eukprot:TRINITY_DN77562_c0_g1_i1.p1 TRINITY_DN77562_c0_g1~~TRINITY_DN77562_c0_g1_i1.p1  ORF type:complete len:178 (-),score=39.49 TRINITY_DN77562_c0_g1_i1:101-634(-)
MFGQHQPPATAMHQNNQMSREDGLKKVRRTIGWYNNHGNLKRPIIYKTIGPAIEAMAPREALRILKTFEEKATQIDNPTYWLKKAADNDPDLDPKVRKTIGWYNAHGGLVEPINYPEVKADLAKLTTWEQLQILNNMQDKCSVIMKPTAWICKAAQKHCQRQGGKGWSGGKGWQNSW